MTREMDTHLATGNRSSVAGLTPQHFGWRVVRQVGVITLNRPERKNPLTFDSYAELRDLFRTLAYADDVRAVVIQGEGGNFCSGGDVHEIIGPLIAMSMPDLLTFTRMTGDLVKAMRACGQPIIAAIDGVCAGAGATWVRAASCRASSARGGPRNCSTPAARCPARRRWPGASTTGSPTPRRSAPRRSTGRQSWPTARASATR
jgi:Enoyl-CoA hydratase/isomerase